MNVKYGGKHVPKSPVKIDVKPKADASKCKLKGPGLESPVVNEPTSFDVDCKRAGESQFAVPYTAFHDLKSNDSSFCFRFDWSKLLHALL